MTCDPFLESISRLDKLDFLQAEEGLSYRDSLELMRERGLGSILVCRGGRLTGIFTERDILNKLVLEAPPANTPVREFMTRPVVTAGEGATVGDAVRLMHGKHIRNLPIVDAEGRPKGLLTVGRIIRLLAAHYPAEVVNLPPKPGQVTEEVEGA